MQRFWSGDIRFNADNFGFQPIWLIIQALEHGAKLQHEELHLQELGIATLSALFLNANRDPKKGQAAKSEDFYHFKAKGDTQIPGNVCDAFFSLTSDDKIPEWAIDLAPIELLRKNQKNAPVRGVRAWLGDDVLIVCPVASADEVRTAFAIVNEGDDRVSRVCDVDNPELCFEVSIEGGEACWIDDEKFLIERDE